MVEVHDQVGYLHTSDHTDKSDKALPAQVLENMSGHTSTVNRACVEAMYLLFGSFAV